MATRRRSNSRPARWQAACDELRRSIEKLEEAEVDGDSLTDEQKETLADPVSALRDLQSEYEDWLGNLPESLQSSALGEKLQAMVDMSLDDPDSIDDAQTLLDEAEGADLPRGFGND
jgi:septal ring factor EnvC (AmiA/AmiB activator)